MKKILERFIKLILISCILLKVGLKMFIKALKGSITGELKELRKCAIKRLVYFKWFHRDNPRIDLRQ